MSICISYIRCLQLNSSKSIRNEQKGNKKCLYVAQWQCFECHSIYSMRLLDKRGQNYRNVWALAVISQPLYLYAHSHRLASGRLYRGFWLNLRRFPSLSFGSRVYSIPTAKNEAKPARLFAARKNQGPHAFRLFLTFRVNCTKTSRKLAHE